MANSTTFQKGQKRPNQGKRGPAKNTQEIKNMILKALSNAGGVAYLTRRAKDPKTATAFLGLVGKIMPTQVTGADGAPVALTLHVNFD